jgi:hypothetical protein
MWFIRIPIFSRKGEDMKKNNFYFLLVGVHLSLFSHFVAWVLVVVYSWSGLLYVFPIVAAYISFKKLWEGHHHRVMTSRITVPFLVGTLVGTLALWIVSMGYFYYGWDPILIWTLLPIWFVATFAMSLYWERLLIRVKVIPETNVW